MQIDEDIGVLKNKPVDSNGTGIFPLKGEQFPRANYKFFRFNSISLPKLG